MPRWLSIKQAAAQIDMSYWFVYSAIHEPLEEKRLKAARFGSTYRILQSDFDDYISKSQERVLDTIASPPEAAKKRAYRKRQKPVNTSLQLPKFDPNNFRVQDLAKSLDEGA